MFEEEGTHQRNASTRSFLHRSVDIRKQAIAGFDVAAANGFMLGAMNPGLLIARTEGGVIAVDGEERSKLEPPSEKFRGRTGVESAHIIAHHRVATDSQAEEHGDAEFVIIPDGGDVAGPRRGIALSSRVCCASQYERALVGTE